MDIHEGKDYFLNKYAKMMRNLLKMQCGSSNLL